MRIGVIGLDRRGVREEIAAGDATWLYRPLKDQKEMTIVLMMGVSGSGKTTIAAGVAREQGGRCWRVTSFTLQPTSQR